MIIVSLFNFFIILIKFIRFFNRMFIFYIRYFYLIVGDLSCQFLLLV
jgi:hypothetical protein